MGAIMAHDKKVSAQAVQHSSNNGPAARAAIEESKGGAGSTAGAENEPVPMTENVDYKADNRYANSIGKKQEAVSEFTKSKTLKEQREYLPVFGVRE